MQTLTIKSKSTTNYTTSFNNNNSNLSLDIMERRRKSSENTNFHKCRRRRRQRNAWHHNNNNNNNHNNISSNTTTATTTRSKSTTTARIRTTNRRFCYRNVSKSGAYLTLLLLSTTCSLGAVAFAVSSLEMATTTATSISTTTTSTSSPASISAANTGFVAPSSPCAPQHWWDQSRGKCTPCTSCQGEMIPLRPCQLHIDTVCGSIYDLKIDWVVLAKTEPNWKERRKSSEYEHFDHATPLQHLTQEQLQQLHEEAAAALTFDWQTYALFCAVLACLLFFSAAACILLHHMRQWRRMERRLDQDVEELSTKLMAKLAEVQSLDGGTFFIGNADALRGLPASAAAAAAASAAQSGMFQPQHVLLPVEKPVKHQERRILKTLQPGNVYIEENNGVGMGMGMGMGIGVGMGLMPGSKKG